MKRFAAVAVVVILSVFVAASAFAASAHSNTGCGLGTLLWKNSADNSVLSQSLQATTNGISGNQTFGITTGTLECERPANFAKNERLNEFVAGNMDNLAKDIAMGKGETLDAFADLLQVPAENRADFYGKLQANFSRIFTGEHVVMANVVDNTAAVAAQ